MHECHSCRQREKGGKQQDLFYSLNTLRCMQRHILKYRRHGTTAHQVAGRWGQIKRKICAMGEKYFVLGWLEQPRQYKNLLYRHDEPNEPTMERPLSFVLMSPPFGSVSTVSRGTPLLSLWLQVASWAEWKLQGDTCVVLFQGFSWLLAERWMSRTNNKYFRVSNDYFSYPRFHLWFLAVALT